MVLVSASGQSCASTNGSTSDRFMAVTGILPGVKTMRGGYCHFARLPLVLTDNTAYSRNQQQNLELRLGGSCHVCALGRKQALL